MELYFKKYKQHLISRLEFSLSYFAQRIIPRTTFKGNKAYDVLVRFNRQEHSGDASYSTIILSKKHILELIQNIRKDLTEYLSMHGCISNDIVMWKEVNRQHRFKLRLIHLNRLVSSFLHELVHIRQHTTQDNPFEIVGKCRQLEYRSYLVSRKEFIESIKRLKGGNKTDEDIKIHASSPQEIPARAHGSVSKYIGMNVHVNPLTLQHSIKDMCILEHYINMMHPQLFDKRYEQFNIPDTEEYRIYKKYMKVVYREIMSYKQYLIGIREYLKSNPPV